MQREGRAATLAIASTAMLASFLQTIMVPAVPELPERFGIDASAASWVLTAALLAACATAPLSGRLGDVIGRRRMLVVLLAIITLGSVVGAIFDTFAGFVVARSLQGAGLGVMALNVGVLRDVVSPERLSGAVVSVSASNGIGGALGLPLSAAVTQFLDPRALFALAAVLSLASAAAVLATVGWKDVPTRGRIDGIGAVLLAAGVTGVILALSQWPVWPPVTIGALAAGGLATLAVWVAHELRTPTPLIDLRTVFRGRLLLVNLLAITAGFGWFAVPGLVMRLLQSSDGPGPGLGLNMITASIIVVPTGLSMLLFARSAKRLAARFGPKTTLVIGATLTLAGFAFGVIWMEQPWHLSIVAALVGMGSVLVFSASALVIVGSVPPAATGAANSVNSVSRWLGSAIASATIGAVLAASSTVWEGAPVPTGVGYHGAFAAALTAAAIGIVLASLLPRIIPRSSSADVITDA